MLIRPIWDWNTQAFLISKGRMNMLIRPIWDWNQIQKTILRKRKRMLIRPIWDWNGLCEDKVIISVLNVNQTNLGLKYERSITRKKRRVKGC